MLQVTRLVVEHAQRPPHDSRRPAPAEAATDARVIARLDEALRLGLARVCVRHDVVKVRIRHVAEARQLAQVGDVAVPPVGDLRGGGVTVESTARRMGSYMQQQWRALGKPPR